MTPKPCPKRRRDRPPLRASVSRTQSRTSVTSSSRSSWRPALLPSSRDRSSCHMPLMLTSSLVQRTTMVLYRTRRVLSIVFANSLRHRIFISRRIPRHSGPRRATCTTDVINDSTPCPSRCNGAPVALIYRPSVLELAQHAGSEAGAASDVWNMQCNGFGTQMGVSVPETGGKE